MADHVIRRLQLAPGGEHAPRYHYDCGRCQYSWCCGTLCVCTLERAHFKLEKPPRERQDEVDADLRSVGYAPQYRGKGAQRR